MIRVWFKYKNESSYNSYCVYDDESNMDSILHDLWCAGFSPTSHVIQEDGDEDYYLVEE